MEYKSKTQKLALEKQGDFLQKFNKESKIFKTKEEENKVIELYQQGLSSIQIAKIFNCSKPVILKILKPIPKTDRRKYKHLKCYNQYGTDNASWKGGIKDVYDRFRDLSEYYEWRKQVLERDNNCCTECNSKDKLHSHHIKTLKSLILDYCSLNNLTIENLTRQHLIDSYFYDISNGLTLCELCHKKWHKEHGR